MGDSPSQSNEFKPPEWTAGRFPGAMDAAESLASKPYEQYQGMRVAPMNPWQHTAGQLTVDRALYGDPGTNAARGSLMNISMGNAANPFMNNAYTDKMIADTADDMTSAYQRGEGLHNSILMARKGAFGGSADLEKQTQGAAALADRIGKMATATRQQDLTRQGNLWNQDVNNVMNASGMSLPFSQNDQLAFDALNRYGGQQQNYTQALLNESSNEFNRQQNYPMQMMDWYLSTLAKGSGQYGTNWSNGGGQSPWATAAGLGMAGYGLLS